MARRKGHCLHIVKAQANAVMFSHEVCMVFKCKLHMKVVSEFIKGSPISRHSKEVVGKARRAQLSYHDSPEQPLGLLEPLLDLLGITSRANYQCTFLLAQSMLINLNLAGQLEMHTYNWPVKFVWFT